MSTVSQDVNPTIGFDELPSAADFQAPANTVTMPEQENDLPFYLIRPPPSNLQIDNRINRQTIVLMIFFVFPKHLKLRRL